MAASGASRKVEEKPATSIAGPVSIVDDADDDWLMDYAPGRALGKDELASVKVRLDRSKAQS